MKLALILAACLGLAGCSKKEAEPCSNPFKNVERVYVSLTFADGSEACFFSLEDSNIAVSSQGVINIPKVFKRKKKTEVELSCDQ